MSSHRVSCNTPSYWVHREQSRDEVRSLLGHIGVHVVILGPGLCCGIYIEPSSGTKVPTIILSVNVSPPRTSIREHHSQPHPSSFLGVVSLGPWQVICGGETPKIV